MKTKKYTDWFGTTIIAEINPPEWVKKAMRNSKRRAQYYAKKHNISIERATQILEDKFEESLDKQEGN